MDRSTEPMRSPADVPRASGADGDSIRRLKESLRRKAIALREGTPAPLRAAWSAAARERIAALRCWRDARTVGLFAAIRGEVDLLPIVADALSRGKRVAFPRADRAAGTLAFHAVDSAGDLRPGAFGVPEPQPDPASRVACADIDLLFVPGVAFDASGRRLGFGGGYYDRLLASMRPEAAAATLALGLTFECQVFPEVPVEPSDQRVNALVTETRSLWCDVPGSPDRML
jgi:5-formyltetrahydrofolate cyclo-ligase